MAKKKISGIDGVVTVHCPDTLFVVTGFSGKLNGFLHVVDAGSEQEAIVRVAEVRELRWARIDSLAGSAWVMYSSERTKEQVEAEYRNSDEVRWWWLVGVEKVRPGKLNHPKAVVW